MITLYDYWRSSASYRVRIALGLAGLEWRTCSVNLLEAEHRSEAHLKRNPQGLVPALEIDGRMLTQSLAIIEYLDETRNMGLLPQDPAERARVRAMAHAIAMEIHPVCNLGVARYATAHSGGGISMESWMQHFIPKGLAAFEEMIDGGDHCYGDTVTMADICLIPQLYNAHRWGIDMAGLPKIRRVASVLETIPAFAAAHPDRTPH